jgi:hypothetical protein
MERQSVWLQVQKLSKSIGNVFRFSFLIKIKEAMADFEEGKEGVWEVGEGRGSCAMVHQKSRVDPRSQGLAGSTECETIVCGHNFTERPVSMVFSSCGHVSCKVQTMSG